MPEAASFTTALSCSTARGFQSTLDGGHVWTTNPLPNGYGFLSALACPSAATCAGLTAPSAQRSFSGTATVFVRTSTAGRYWKRTAFPRSERFASLACPSVLDCVVVGSRFEQVPLSQTLINPSTLSRSQRLAFAAEPHPALPQGAGVPIASITVRLPAAGLVLRTSDGGRTWSHGSFPLPVTNPARVACEHHEVLRHRLRGGGQHDTAYRDVPRGDVVHQLVDHAGERGPSEK
ncbi:MAG: hypothetical protein ACYCV7_02055 [Acidimicrobiales bacterium]